MSGNDEQVECPLCMEPLEIDDINFFPCTCGYQICRFCWHRIRTDENGLCPACRKAYPEDPAKFNPLTEDELQRIKKERRQKDIQRKQKAAENRKHLANVRVVQKNLVFVVGLSQRLADPEVLRKHEYFGKFGKIHKVVINQSTSYAGAQGPSASAYVTYNKAEDALKAILNVNNVHIDGRTLKASLGTTKYCSHFLRGTQCPKTDCMYLHELGEEAASFTKEEMQVGKHQEYEQKLLEQHMNSQNSAHNNQVSNKIASTTRKKTSSPTNIIQPSQSPPQTQIPSPPVSNTSTQRQNLHTNAPGHQIPPNPSNKDCWPSLQQSGANKPADRVIGNNTTQSHTDKITDKTKTEHNTVPGKHRIETNDTQRLTDTFNGASTTEQIVTTVTTSPRQPNPQSIINSLGNKRKSLGLDNCDNLSLFSSINGFHGARNPKPPVQQTDVPDIPTTEIPDTIPVSSSTDWQAAFGFGQSTSNCTTDWQDDDLGFDPLEESSKGLAALLEKENVLKQNSSISNSVFDSHKFHNLQPHSRPIQNNMSQNVPPGFSVNHIQGQTHLAGIQKAQPQSTPFSQKDSLSSRMMGYGSPSVQNSYPDMFSDLSLLGKDHMTQPNRTQTDCFNMKDWQDGLRALLPNINISFGSQSADARANLQHNSAQKNWASNTVQATDPSSWMAYDPAILTSGTISDGSNLQDPHWFKSINQLTDLDTTNHRLPFVQQFPVRNTMWPPQTHNPPPGFQTHIRPPLQTADPHKLAEGLQ